MRPLGTTQSNATSTTDSELNHTTTSIDVIHAVANTNQAAGVDNCPTEATALCPVTHDSTINVGESHGWGAPHAETHAIMMVGNALASTTAVTAPLSDGGAELMSRHIIQSTSTKTPVPTAE